MPIRSLHAPGLFPGTSCCQSPAARHFFGIPCDDQSTNGQSTLSYCKVHRTCMSLLQLSSGKFFFSRLKLFVSSKLQEKTPKGFNGDPFRLDSDSAYCSCHTAPAYTCLYPHCESTSQTAEALHLHYKRVHPNSYDDDNVLALSGAPLEYPRSRFRASVLMAISFRTILMLLELSCMVRSGGMWTTIASP